MVIEILAWRMRKLNQDAQYLYEKLDFPTKLKSEEVTQSINVSSPAYMLSKYILSFYLR